MVTGTNPDKTDDLRLKHFSLDLSQPRVMGILNVTPDSFSDGGKYTHLDKALFQAEKMYQAGAAIIDVGGESTRPGAATVPLQQELDRVIPVIEALSRQLDVAISIDTSKPQVMQAAVAAGAVMVNDVRALQVENAIDVVRKLGVPVCLMHMQGQPRNMQQKPDYDQVNQEVYRFLEQRIQSCVDNGIAPDQILIDPGFGFGKTVQHNLLLLKYLRQFKKLHVPLLVGLSRKSLLAGITQKEVGQRLSGSLALAVIAALNGADIIRVHDVEETMDALKVVSAVQSAESYQQ